MWSPPPATATLSDRDLRLAVELTRRFGDAVRQSPDPSDFLTFEIAPESVKPVLTYLKTEATPRYQRLEDLTVVDESARRDRDTYPDYTLVYHLLSFDPASRLRLKAPLTGGNPTHPSITDIWPSANWYEREVFDMFGIRFADHPDLRRILMPDHWKGHPCEKSIRAGRPRWPPTRKRMPAPASPGTGAVFLRRRSTPRR